VSLDIDKRPVLPPAVAYVGSVFLERVFSFITVPLMAVFLKPGEYGQYDRAVSLIDFFAVITALGLADCVVRFVTTAPDENAQKRALSELLGVGLAVACAVGVVSQLVLPYLVAALHIKVGLVAVRCSVAALSVVALADASLCWVRFKGRSDTYFLFVAIRAVALACATILALTGGYGVEGIMISNAALLIAISGVTFALVAHESGLGFSEVRARQLFEYGLPLIGAGLLMFVLGSCNRWFLTDRVSDAEIGYFGLASRLSMMVAVGFAPFILWWGPKRIAVLQTAEGAATTARVWGQGVCLLILAAAGVSLAGPIFIELFLPKAYAPAEAFMPVTALLQVLATVCVLSNSSVYARPTGVPALAVDITGVVGALVGFYVLVPPYGIAGAIAATALGHGIRMVLLLGHGYAVSRIPFPLVPAVATVAVAGLIVWAAPAAHGAVIARTIWMAIAVLLIGRVMWFSGLLQDLPDWHVPAFRVLKIARSWGMAFRESVARVASRA